MPLPILIEIETCVVDVHRVVALVVLHLDHHDLLYLNVGVVQIVRLRVAAVVLRLPLLGVRGPVRSCVTK